MRYQSLFTRDIEIRISINEYFGQESRIGSDIVIGLPLIGGKPVSVSELEIIRQECISETACCRGSLLSSLNGFFTIIIIKDGAVFLISDRVRSRPIFFAIKGSVVWISDDAFWVGDASGNREPDRIAQELFLRSLYTPGSRTVIRGVHQICAGQIARLSRGEEIRWLSIDLLSASGCPDVSLGKDYLIERVTHALYESVKTACDIANGNQIVVPLSGGLDSRALLIGLKKQKYDNILLFNYGIKYSADYRIARGVADALGYRLIQHRLGLDRWRRTVRSPHFQLFHRRSFSLTSCPNLQGFPSVAHLAESGQISPKAMFLPGHTGDFLAGKQLEEIFFQGNDVDFNFEMLLDLIVKRHFILNNENKISSESMDELVRLVARVFDRDRGSSPSSRVLRSVQEWNQIERQSKFICNSNRYYDYFGFSWWMPLWDARFIKAWEVVPLSYRQNSRLWWEVVNGAMASVIGIRGAKRVQNLDQAYRSRRLFNKVLGRVDPNGLVCTMPIRTAAQHLFHVGRTDTRPLAWWARETLRRCPPGGLQQAD